MIRDTMEMGKRRVWMSKVKARKQPFWVSLRQHLSYTNLKTQLLDRGTANHYRVSLSGKTG